MSSPHSSASDDDDAFLRAAAAAHQAKQTKSAGASKPKKQQQQQATKSADAPSSRQSKSRSANASDDEKEDDEGASTGRGKGKSTSQTSYDAWKAKQHQTKTKSTRTASDSDEEPRKGSRAQQREAALAASQPKQPREAKAARVPIKVERAKATRQADIDSGVAGALRQLAIKKKLKQQKKKAKKFAAGGDEDEDDDEEDEDASDAASDDHSGSDDKSETEDASPVAASASKSAGGDESETELAAGAEEPDEYDTLEDSVNGYREQNSIHVMSTDESVVTSAAIDADPMFFPITAFESLRTEFMLDPKLVDAATGSFAKPTPIQAQCWPILLGGKDVIGIASTGSGKTAAFTLPAIYYILQIREREARKAAAAAASGIAPTAAPSSSELAPRVLVLAPTRELAIQIHKVAHEITTKMAPASSTAVASSSSAALTTPIQSYVVFGGTSLEAQLTSMRSLASLDLLVATPGRLLKHLKEQSVTLKRIGYFVLDEADRMLDLGFEESLREISELIPPKRQTCLFSATWEASAQKAAEAFLKRGAANCIKVVVGSEDLTAAKSVKQIVEVIDRRQGKREKRLCQLLEEYHATRTNRILIFVLYKKEAQLLSDHLLRKGWKSAAISGDRTQTQRLEALERFRSGEVPILVATDVAARGLDVKNITHVINFSLGLSVEQYIHRVGRCGRAGTTGLAHTFVVDYDAPHTPALVKVLEESPHAEISPELREMAERAARQAAKHASSAEAGLKGDAYFASLKAGAQVKNVNVAKQLAKEAEEEAIEALIFGDQDEATIAGGVAKGKKPAHHAAGRSKAGGGKKPGKGGRAR